MTCGILVSQQEIELRAQQSKCQILTTGSPGNFQDAYIFKYSQFTNIHLHF